MIHFNKLAATLTVTLALFATTNSVHAQSQNLQEKVKNYFLQTLKAKQNAALKSKANYTRNTNDATKIQKQLKDNDVVSSKEMVWSAWCEANRELQEEKLIKPESLQNGGGASWNLPQELEPNAVMPYYFGSKGKADGKMPLFLYLHGSGPKEQEWQNGLIL